MKADRAIVRMCPITPGRQCIPMKGQRKNYCQRVADARCTMTITAPDRALNRGYWRAG
jgi:hypothetical protein